MAGEDSSLVRPPRGWPWFLVALFAGSAIWRLMLLQRLAGSPLDGYLSADSEIYWAWADQIRAGQFLSQVPFFFGPLYPYWLALLRAATGNGMRSVLIFQALLGAAAIPMLADACRRMTGWRPAAITAVAMAGYSMAVVLDLQILMDGLLFSLGSAALWVATRGGRAAPTVLGGLIGLMSLGRPTFLLTLAPCAAVLAWRSPAGRLRALAELIAIPVVILAGVIAIQWPATGEIVPITYSSGFNLYVGNGPRATGTFVPFADAIGAGPESGPLDARDWDGRAYLSATKGVHLSATESSRYWADETARFVSRSPGQAAWLMLRKLAMLLNHRELPQIMDPDVYWRTLGPLGWPIDFEFPPFLALGLLGAVVGWSRIPRSRLVVGWLVTLVISAAGFFVVDRYRIHLLPPLALLTSAGLASLAGFWRARSHRSLAASLGLIAAVVGLAWLPAVPPSNRAWLHAVTIGEAWIRKGEPERSIPWLEKAAAMGRGGSLHGADTQTGRLARAALYENLGVAYSLVGETHHAVESLAEATRLAPDSRSTRTRYADQLAIGGSGSEAVRQYGIAGVTTGQAGDHLARQAIASLERADTLGAVRCLQAVLTLAPGNEPAHVALVRLAIHRADLQEARRRLVRASEAGVDSLVVRAHSAWILAEEGDLPGARQLLRSIPQDAAAGNPGLRGTLDLVLATLR